MKTTTTALSRMIQTAIFGALALSCATLSIAADSSDVPQVVVKFGDLNLSNPQGAAKLYGRIVVASHIVCRGFDGSSKDLGSRSRLDACVNKAIADAVSSVARPEVLAIYRAKSHQPLPIIVAAAQTR